MFSKPRPSTRTWFLTFTLVFGPADTILVVFVEIYSHLIFSELYSNEANTEHSQFTISFICWINFTFLVHTNTSFVKFQDYRCEHQMAGIFFSTTIIDTIKKHENITWVIFECLTRSSKLFSIFILDSISLCKVVSEDLAKLCRSWSTSWRAFSTINCKVCSPSFLRARAASV